MAGRPKKELDLRTVEKLAMYPLTVQEMADILDCGSDLLHKRYSSTIKKGRSQLKYKILRSQLNMMEKSPAMSIWLGKNYCDQKDNQADEKKVREFVTEIINFAGATQQNKASA